MIFVDRREKDVARYLDDPLEVELEYGDYMFEGNGPEGRVEIGIERKRIDDLVNSILTGRLSGHQIPGLLDHYYHTYIMVEGLWMGDDETDELMKVVGVRIKKVERGRRTIRARDVWTYLTTLEVMCGVTVRQTPYPSATGDLINYLFHWWNKEWGKHRGHLAMHKHPQPGSMRTWRPSLVAKIASELPGIGWGRAAMVEKRFKSVREMMEAGVEEWEEVDGIGKVTARLCWEAIRKGGEEE